MKNKWNIAVKIRKYQLQLKYKSSKSVAKQDSGQRGTLSLDRRVRIVEPCLYLVP